MKINRLVPIISTEKIEELKEFYMINFGFCVLFANYCYILLESQDKTLQIAFVISNHEGKI